MSRYYQQEKQEKQHYRNMASAASIVTNPSSGVDRLVAQFTEAIYTGNVHSAKELVCQMSNCHLKLNIHISKDQNRDASKEKEFCVTVHVEDRETSGTRLQLQVKSSDTISDIKRKVWLQYDIPTEVQRWIVGKKIPDDWMTLGKCGVAGSGHTLFLYVITTCSSRKQMDSESESGCYGNNKLEASALSSTIMSANLSYEEQGKDIEMLLMSSPDVMRNSIRIEATKPIPVNNPENQSLPPPIPERIPLEDDADDIDQTVKVVLNPLMRVIPPPSKKDTEPVKRPPGWECGECTFYNLPTRPGCEMCAKARPQDYAVPQDYQMTDRELAMKVHQEELERLTRRPVPEETIGSVFESLGYRGAGGAGGGSGGLSPAGLPVSSSFNPSAHTHHYLFQKFLQDGQPSSSVHGKENNQNYPFLKDSYSDDDEDDGSDGNESQDENDNKVS